MNFADQDRWQLHGSQRLTMQEKRLTMLVFAAVGAVTWAIRGTNGWGGIDGTLIPGLSWGILWWYVCWRRGIDARSVPLWLGLGIALGGELGYGQYVSWIRGRFESSDGVLSVSPWIGWAWFAVCGIGWGAPGGILLGWTLSRRRTAAQWLMRLTMPVGVAILVRLLIQQFPWLFFPNWHPDVYVSESGVSADPADAAATQAAMITMWFLSAAMATLVWLISTWVVDTTLTRGITFVGAVGTVILQMIIAEWLFFPGDQLGLFAGELDRHAGRTVYTNSQNTILAGWWIGALLVAAAQRDRVTVTGGVVVGGGFGVGFPLAAVWCLGYVYAPDLIDWWKMWELQSGVHLGLLYAVMLVWCIHRVHADAARDGDSDEFAGEEASTYEQWCRSGAAAAGGLWILWWMSRDEFPVVGLLLGCVLAAGLMAAVRETALADERRKGMTFVYSRYLLWFIMMWGLSSQLGIVLGLYDATMADQYAWPAPRIILFTPAAVLLTVVSLWQMRHVCRSESTLIPSDQTPRVSQRLIDLIMAIGVVGAVTIWPSKIGALYALCLAVAISAFIRLNMRPDAATGTDPVGN